MSRSAYGFSAGGTEGWHTRALCAGKDPKMFVVTSGGRSAANDRALLLCGACPVRESCRDDMRRGDPRAIIAGGWAWNFRGVPIPYPGDEHLLRSAEKPAPTPTRRGGWRRPTKVTAERFLAAGERLWVHGEDIATVVAQVGLSKAMAYSARQIYRDVPHLIPKIRAAEISVAAALQEARVVAGTRGRGSGVVRGRGRQAAREVETRG
jgi:hypothetical protein